MSVTQTRDRDRETDFDVAVIGGGIAGAAVARDAALRGLSVILFEKNTFGSGTSSKSSKLIHGGIRYLEIAWHALKKGNLRESWKNFSFVFLSLRESRILEKIAPGLVEPILLVIPIYRSGSAHPASIYFGAILYSLLGLLMGNPRCLRTRILSTQQAVLRLVPNLTPEGLQGGVAIWDHRTRDQELVRRTIASAVCAGTRALEHAEVTRYRFDKEKKRFEIIVGKDGGESVYRAVKLVNASGPWVDILRERGGERGEDFIMPVAGSHLTFKKFVDHSVILKAPDERIFFVINVEENSRVGTTERVETNPDRVDPQPEEVEYLLDALRHYFPRQIWRREDILSQDAGTRPLARPEEETSPHMISREHEIRVGPTGAIHVIGVKLTDHRRAAREVVDRVDGGLRQSVTHLRAL